MIEGIRWREAEVLEVSDMRRKKSCNASEKYQWCVSGGTQEPVGHPRWVQRDLVSLHDKIIKVGKDLHLKIKCNPSSPPLCPLTTSLSATSPRSLSISRDGDPTTSLGILCQRISTIWEKKSFLISTLNLPGTT